jgi:glutaredoxin
VSARILTLVTGADCHLCAHAREVLARLGAATREIDVGSGEAQALARLGIPLAFLPVLCDGERVLGYGRLSEKRLQRELAR